MPADLRERIPTQREILGVFAATAFIAYTWTMFVSFWKLPSWLFFLELGEIASMYAYALLVNFAESLLLLGIALLPCLFFPRTWWKDAFVAKGATLAVIVLASAQLHLSKYSTLDLRDEFVGSQGTWWLYTLWIAAFLTWLAGRVVWLKKGLEKVADQLSVFLYIYIPLTVFGLLAAIARIIR